MLRRTGAGAPLAPLEGELSAKLTERSLPQQRLRICRKQCEIRSILLQNLSVSALPSHLPFQGRQGHIRFHSIKMQMLQGSI